MRRHLLIAVAVLLPFTALVWLGFWLLKDAPSVVPAPAVRMEPPVAARPHDPPSPRALVPEPIRPLPLALEIAPLVMQPRSPREIAPSPELSPEAKRLPMLAAVEPLVQQCFMDVSDRVRVPIEVMVSFNATSSGGFENIVIKKTSWQDPQVSACIIDAFEDAHFEPSGLTMRRQAYTFTFVPDGGS